MDEIIPCEVEGVGVAEIEILQCGCVQINLEDCGGFRVLVRNVHLLKCGLSGDPINHTSHVHTIQFFPNLVHYRIYQKENFLSLYSSSSIEAISNVPLSGSINPPSTKNFSRANITLGIKLSNTINQPNH